MGVEAAGAVVDMQAALDGIPWEAAAGLAALGMHLNAAEPTAFAKWNLDFVALEEMNGGVQWYGIA